MKKLILMIVSIAVFSSCTLAMTPPDAVLKTFKKMFPTVAKVNWGKENAKEWEAEFTLNGNKISANYTFDGIWIETEQEITVKELPVPVYNEIQKHYPGWKIIEVDKTETAKNGSIYEADIKNGRDKKSVAFKEDGKIVIE